MTSQCVKNYKYEEQFGTCTFFVVSAWLMDKPPNKNSRLVVFKYVPGEKKNILLLKISKLKKWVTSGCENKTVLLR